MKLILLPDKQHINNKLSKKNLSAGYLQSSNNQFRQQKTLLQKMNSKSRDILGQHQQ
jgi:hypothetical protein